MYSLATSRRSRIPYSPPDKTKVSGPKSTIEVMPERLGFLLRAGRASAESANCVNMCIYPKSAAWNSDSLHADPSFFDNSSPLHKITLNHGAEFLRRVSPGFVSKTGE